MVTATSSSRSSEMPAPKMMLALGSTTSCTRLAASLTSSRDMSNPPRTLMMTPVAPSMVVSSRGLETAWRTALIMRLSPLARPMPMWAMPLFFMTERTSAKSRLMSEGLTMRSEIALDGLAQHVVGNAEGVHHRGPLGHHLQQLVVGDDDQGVHILAEVGDARPGVGVPVFALEREGPGDHGHSQDAHLLGDGGHDGGRSGAGAATHARRDEQKIGPPDGLGDGVAALLGGLFADLGIAAGAQAPGELVPDLDAGLGLGQVEGLFVGVERHELRALDVGVDHAVDRVVAASADAQNFDLRNGRYR